MSDIASDTLPALEGGVGLHRKKSGWFPVYVAAALGFAFVIGFGDQTAGTLPRVVLGVGGAAVAVAIVLVGQIILTLRGKRRFPYLEEMPTHAALEEEKVQVLAAIKEIDFDHDMNKIDDRDYRDLRNRYEAEALRVLKAIDDERRAWEKKATEVAKGHLAKAGLTLSPVPGLRRKRDVAKVLEAEAPKKQKKQQDAEAAARAPGDPGQEDKRMARDAAAENGTQSQATAPAGAKEAAAEAPRGAGAEAPAAAEAPSGPEGLTCDGCGRDNDPDAVFCVGCGRRLVAVPRTCPSCETENEADARFCKRCGTKLEEAEA